MERWLWFGLIVAFVAGLVGVLLRLMPSDGSSARDVQDEHHRAIDRYAWGRYIPGFGAFWVALTGLSSGQKGDGDAASDTDPDATSEGE